MTAQILDHARLLYLFQCDF